MLTLKSYLGVIAALFIAFPAAAIELVMIDQDGCVYCEQWHEEIGGIYSNTTEGKFAPLRVIDIYEIPDDLEIARRVVFTPTFLIIDDGKELARLEGYPGLISFGRCWESCCATIPISTPTLVTADAPPDVCRHGSSWSCRSRPCR